MTVEILYIEDNPSDFILVRELLKRAAPGYSDVHLTPAGTLSEGLEILSRGKTDLVLMDLSLPDGDGKEAFKFVFRQAPHVPVVVLTGNDDESLGIEVVQAGAQDHLLKDTLDGKNLRRVILYAIERNRMRLQLLDLSLTDELTGLYNRRGFILLAEQQMKLAHRSHKGLMLFVIDLDDFKKINDTLGHAKGDAVLRLSADMLRTAFRKSDIIGRLGGDEFAVAAIDADAASEEILRGRLKNLTDEYNKQKKMSLPVEMSVGAAHFNRAEGKKETFLEQLLEAADRSLYRAKHANKQKLSPQ